MKTQQRSSAWLKVTACVLTLVALLTGVAFVSSTSAAKTQHRPKRFWTQPDKTEVYKKVKGVELKMHIYFPKDWKASDQRPAIVFFFGGGWYNGSPRQFYPHCFYLASRGMVAMSAEYRVYSRNKAKVVECVADAKSAIRWVRKNARRLGIDPQKIASGGGSAGGHLAACVGTLKQFDEPNEDLSISSKPQLMVLFNPVLDLTQKWKTRLQKRLGADPAALSPLCHVTKGTPPCILFHGTADTTVPFSQAERFAEKMKELGNECELHAYKGRKHGFFNFGRNGGQDFLDTVEKADRFLEKHGFLQGKPTIRELFDKTGS